MASFGLLSGIGGKGREHLVGVRIAVPLPIR
jgi:hypothetical protein